VYMGSNRSYKPQGKNLGQTSSLQSIEYATPLLTNHGDWKLLCMRVFPLFTTVKVVAPLATLDLAQFAMAGKPTISVNCQRVVWKHPIPFLGGVRKLTIRITDGSISAVLKRLHRQALRYKWAVAVRVCFAHKRNPPVYHAWLAKINTWLCTGQHIGQQPSGMCIV
jgi:hypothetical protein